VIGLQAAWMPTPVGWLGLGCLAVLAAAGLARVVFALRPSPPPRTLDLTDVVEPAEVRFDERR
jgi:hypothetical protein